MEIIVLGCGVIGLTTAVRLRELGYVVTVRTADVPPRTTSDKAAAFWSPYRIKDKRNLEWVKYTFEALEALSREPGTGVSMIRLYKYLEDGADKSDSWWLHAVPEGQYSTLGRAQLPEGYAAGWTLMVPLVETPIYLPYLMRRLEAAGGKIVSGEHITQVSDYLGPDRIVINCTGLGSRDLMHDQSMLPIRGQIAVVDTKAVDAIHVDADKPTYLVPRQDGCIVGGTYEEGAWEESPDEHTIDAILSRAGTLFPGLKNARVKRTYAGLRPFRPSVRLEEDPEYPGLIHNYGHGGAGFTVSWGCARSVEDLVKSRS